MAKVLVAAQDLASGWKKGDPVAVYPDSYGWGYMEAPPDFVRLSVPDATPEQIEAFQQQWKSRLSYTINVENAQGYRVTLAVDPDLVSASGANRAVRAELKEYLTNHPDYQISFRGQTANSLQVDIAKPADLAALRADINDKFESVTHFVQYHFSDTDVDWALAHGGEHEMTRAEVLSRIKNRLEE